MRHYFLAFLWSLVIFACDSTNESGETTIKQEVLGTWLLTESGFSPGGGYFVELISPNPAQTIRFRGPKHFHSNIKGLEQYRYYVVQTDSSGPSTLRLYENDPEVIESTGSVLDSYRIEQKAGTLKLMNRRCIEGCHLGFTRIGVDQQ